MRLTGQRDLLDGELYWGDLVDNERLVGQSKTSS